MMSNANIPVGPTASLESELKLLFEYRVDPNHVIISPGLLAGFSSRRLPGNAKQRRGWRRCWRNEEGRRNDHSA